MAKETRPQVIMMRAIQRRAPTLCRMTFLGPKKLLRVPNQGGVATHPLIHPMGKAQDTGLVALGIPMPDHATQPIPCLPPG